MILKKTQPLRRERFLNDERMSHETMQILPKTAMKWKFSRKIYTMKVILR